MPRSSYFTRTTLLLISLLIIVAVVLSIASYQYSTQVSHNVANLSIDEIHSNSQIEASDLGHLLGTSIEDVSAKLDVLAYSHSVSSGNITTAEPIFAVAQNST